MKTRASLRNSVPNFRITTMKEEKLEKKKKKLQNVFSRLTVLLAQFLSWLCIFVSYTVSSKHRLLVRDCVLNIIPTITASKGR